MKGRLYFTVDKQTRVRNGKAELNGIIFIDVYEIVNDIPKLFFNIEKSIGDDAKNEIRAWLFVNGFGTRDYELKEL